MPVEAAYQEDDRKAVVTWTAARRGASIWNPGGHNHRHITRIVSGVVEFRFPGRYYRASAGQEIQLPLREPFAAVTIQAPAVVVCIYSRAISGAYEGTQALRAAGEGSSYASREESEVPSREGSEQLRPEPDPDLDPDRTSPDRDDTAGGGGR